MMSKTDIMEIIDTQNEVIKMQSDLIAKLYSYVKQSDDVKELFELESKVSSLRARLQ